MKKYILILSCLMWLKQNAQPNPLGKNAFMQQEIQIGFEYWNISHPSTGFHSSFRPYLSSTHTSANDSSVPFKHYLINNNFLTKPFHNTELIGRNHFYVQVHPIADFEVGFDPLKSNTPLSYLGGLHLKTFINNNLTLAFTCIGGKNAYPFFLDTTIAKQNLIPEFGQGYRNGINEYSFSDFTGYISFNPKNSKVFNIQIGRDKHFIGDGYRSLLYSDFGPASPYVGINTNIGRVQYNVWYSWMLDVNTANGFKDKFKRKYGTFHYLSYNIIKEIQIGFFENVIWRGTDTNQVRNFEVNYINPVIFLRPQEYSVGSPDNSFIGFNMNTTLFKTLKLYGQLGLDEFYFKEIKARNGWWGNKQAWQFGFKYINAFAIKGLKLQVEYNEARPYTYTHGLVEQNYSHYGQALAHPLGANFKEWLCIVNYRKNNWGISWQGMHATVGRDSLSSKSNVGQNIFLSYNTRTSENGNYTTQGIATKILQSEIKFTYFIIPQLNMRLECSYIQRSESNVLNYRLENPYIYFAFKTSFWNSYKDY